MQLILHSHVHLRLGTQTSSNGQSWLFSHLTCHVVQHVQRNDGESHLLAPRARQQRKCLKEQLDRNVSHSGRYENLRRSSRQLPL